MKPKLTEGEQVSGATILDELDGDTLVESETRVIVPSSGRMFDADGRMKVSVIRPCISKGRRLRGLSPIYTPQMLEANAAVFTGWPMYQDHLMEQAVEDLAEELLEMGGEDLLASLQERARQIKDLGGRVVESYWNPDLTFPDDADYGFQKGGVEAIVIPQPGIRKMLEADPEILNVSINAYPTGGKAGTTPWGGERGLLIEGIRRKPMGSVDWVFRGGAGGRPLLQESSDERRRAAVVLEGAYDYDHDESDLENKGDREVKKLSEMTPDELREHLSNEGASHLIPALAEGTAPTEGMSEQKVATMIAESNETILSELTNSLREAAEQNNEALIERLTEQRENVELATLAGEIIDAAVRGGLSERQAGSMRERYSIDADGVLGTGLLVEAIETEDFAASRGEIVAMSITEEIENFVAAVREAGGEPMIEGFGPSVSDAGDDDVKVPVHSSFRDGLRERGDLSDEAEADSVVSEMIREDN